MNVAVIEPSAMFDLPIRHEPWHPSLMRWATQDLAGVARQREQDHRTHLRGTLEWVCRAQDACPNAASGCVAAGWAFASGWQPANSDVTGGLIETPRDALPNAVLIWSGSAAFGFDTLSAKRCADALMIDMAGIAIPAMAQEVNLP
jgi:hypothetical protein